jgi:hypothetical protein
MNFGGRRMNFGGRRMNFGGRRMKFGGRRMKFGGYRMNFAGAMATSTDWERGCKSMLIYSKLPKITSRLQSLKS